LLPPMSKRGYISRYLLIIKKMRVKQYVTFEELQQYVENQVEYLQMQDDTLTIAFSQRTFQRDIKEIRNIFGIDIEYSKTNKGYYIGQSGRDSMNFQRTMEAFDMFHSLNLAQDLAPFVHLEKRKPQGTENLYGLLHAIKSKLQVRFSYQKFWEGKVTNRVAAPYALKEFRNRWYLLANDNKDQRVKSFALDRLSDLEITTIKFTLPHTFDVEEIYRNCFGIISPTHEAPQEILLSFVPVQGKYVKSLPLHETQQILVNNEDELQIKLHLHITHDLLMELLSFGDNMKVLHPLSLANEIKNAHKSACEQYE
jgi:predicted DNA-binding transcriptional regulator YafY